MKLVSGVEQNITQQSFISKFFLLSLLHQLWLWLQSTASLLLRPILPHGMGITGTDGLLTTTATMERGRPMLSQQQLLRLMPNPGGTETMDTMDILLMATPITGRGLLMRSQQLMLRPNPGGTDITDILHTDTATATTGRGLLMLSPADLFLLRSVLLSTGKDLRQLMPNPGGMETMAMAGLLTAMATMGRGQHKLAMINVTQHHCVTSIAPIKIGVALRSKFPKKTVKMNF